MKLNTKGKERVQINHVALGSSQGSVMMKAGQSDQTHQICRKSEKLSGNGEILKVRMDTIDSYMKNKGITIIDLLKIDVEGYELEVLDGAKQALERRTVKVILAECDFDPDDTQHTYFNDLWNYLRFRNFSFFGLYDVIRYGNRMGIGFCNALFVLKPLSPVKE